MDAPNLYSRPVAQASAAVRLGFLKRVYAWMAYGIGLSALGTFLSIKAGLAESILRGGLLGAILMTVAWMGLGWFANNVRHQPGVNTIAFSLYGLATGIVISGLVYVALIMGKMITGNAMTYIGQAFGVTSLVFGGLSFYAATTKKDFSYLAGFLTVATVGLIGLILIGWIVKSTIFALVISFAGVLIFSGYVLFNTQKILRTYPENEHMAGAMVLFTDFAILFTHILRIILILAGNGRRD